MDLLWHLKGNFVQTMDCNFQRIKQFMRPGPSVERIVYFRCVCTRLGKVNSLSEYDNIDPEKSVWHIARKNLQMKSYRLQLMQHLSPNSMRFFVLMLPMPLDIQNLIQRITTAFATIVDRDILKRLWRKNFTLDLICCITKSSYFWTFVE